MHASSKLLRACLVCDSMSGNISIRLSLEVKLVAASVTAPLPPLPVDLRLAAGESSDGWLSLSRSHERHCSLARHKFFRALQQPPGGNRPDVLFQPGREHNPGDAVE
jgi:hypothetical protein